MDCKSVAHLLAAAKRSQHSHVFHVRIQYYKAELRTFAESTVMHYSRRAASSAAITQFCNSHMYTQTSGPNILLLRLFRQHWKDVPEWQNFMDRGTA